jgi:hypothetical protein
MPEKLDGYLWDWDFVAQVIWKFLMASWLHLLINCLNKIMGRMVSRNGSSTFITSSWSNEVLGLEIYGKKREGKMKDHNNILELVRLRELSKHCER